MAYEAKLAKSPPTETFTDNEGIIRHKTYMHLSYVPNSNKWINGSASDWISKPKGIQQCCEILRGIDMIKPDA
jgi:hypothetical protein